MGLSSKKGKQINMQQYFFSRKNKLAYLIGVFLGDGCIYFGKYAYQFSVTSEDYFLPFLCSEICGELFNKYGTIKCIYKKNGEVSYYQLVICSKRICKILKRLTQNREQIPYIKDKESLKYLVVGLMDSDGWITKINAGDGYCRYRVGFKATNDFVADLHDIFKNSLNILCGNLRTGIDKKRGKKKYFTFCINTKSYYNNLFFFIGRKQKILMEYYKNKERKTNNG